MALHRNCAGFTRRDTLKLGLGGFVGANLAELLNWSNQNARAAGLGVRRPTSCILVWLDGGPSHYESFDPKPLAPKEIRGQFSPIKTAVPGTYFSEHAKQLAAIADKITIVRSIRHNQGNHGAGNHYMMTGAPPRIPVGCGAFVSYHPSLGSVASYERGASGGLPAYFSIPERSRSGGPNFLGAKHAPFVVSDDPNSPGFRVRDVALPEGMTGDRFVGRRDVRSLVDTLPRLQNAAAGDPVTAVDEFYEQSYDLIGSSEAQRAFDINGESDKVRDLYGRSSFGQRALLARRLVEAGVPFITLYDGGWDHHVDVFKGFSTRFPTVDTALAALITDLEQRGLLETTLVVMLGEFGRTPKINEKAGRDHWSNAMSVLFAGCGTPGGQIVGATDKNGYTAVERICSPENFASTVYRKLGIDPGKIYHTPQGRPIHLVTDANPIPECMG